MKATTNGTLAACLLWHAGSVMAMTDADLATYLPDRAEIESRLDADVNGDGRKDIVLVAHNDEARVLLVMAAYESAGASGYEPIGQGALEFGPLGNAGLRMQRNVLVVEDLTGGTSAFATIYRYRFDPAETRMRLIGLDVEFYSRTMQHGSRKLSINYLTGARVAQESELGKDQELVFGTERRSQSKPQRIYLEDTPSPSDLLGFGE
jgi:hypothetical protein